MLISVNGKCINLTEFDQMSLVNDLIYLSIINFPSSKNFLLNA
jgi:hypothetical protein